MLIFNRGELRLTTRWDVAACQAVHEQVGIARSNHPVAVHVGVEAVGREWGEVVTLLQVGEVGHVRIVIMIEIAGRGDDVQRDCDGLRGVGRRRA